MGRKNAAAKRDEKVGEDSQELSAQATSNVSKPKASRNKTRGSNVDYFGLARNVLICVTAFAALCIGTHVITALHEGHTWWSTASVDCKETAFVSEQAFYYLWFKITADREVPYLNALGNVLADRTVEYPTTVNAFQRFTIYPEVVFGTMFRVLNSTGLSLSEPIDYYVHWAFIMQGVLPASIFAVTVITTGSILCGVSAVLCFFTNYEQMTRSWHSIPLRETFALPILYVQYAALTWYIDKDVNQHPKAAAVCRVALVWGLVASIASWQLSASLLMLQLAAMLVLYSLSPQYLPLHKYRTLAWTHVIGVGLASVFLFGNLMTACSLYTCMALSTLAMTYVPQPQEQPKHFVWRALRLLVLVGGVLVASVLLRMFLVFVFQMDDDAHMANLMRAKSGTFKDFHTSVYLKIEGYRGIPFPVITELTWTGLLMAAVLVALAVGLPTIAHFLRGGHALVAAAALCHLGMALQYTVLAATINRLRGIWGPSLCVLAGLLPSEVVWGNLFQNTKYFRILAGWRWKAVVHILMIGAMGFGSSRLKWLREHYFAEGVHERVSVEELYQWVRARTHPEAVIGSDMILSAMLRLSTGRRTVVHPHYEYADARSRNFKQAHWNAYRRLEDVHRLFTEMGMEYYIENGLNCETHSSRGKAPWEMVDEGEDGAPPPPMPRTNELCCMAARHPNPYFKMVYKPPGQSWGFRDFRVYQLLNTTQIRRSAL